MRRPTAFIDVLFQLLLMLLILPHQPETESDVRPPGMVMVEIRWEDRICTDIDLWVLAPTDRPVGFSNRAGDVANLLRDDLGCVRDPLELNYENAFTRSAPEGEYTVNVHLYNDLERAAPLEVTVTASVKVSGATRILFTRTVTLKSMGHEITVARFSLNEYGALVPNSIHDMPKSLRVANNGGPH